MGRVRQPIPSSVRTRVYNSTGGRCAKCHVRMVRQRGYANSFEVDHVWAHSRGGSDQIRNLQPLCYSCNRSKGASTADYRASCESHAQRVAANIAAAERKGITLFELALWRTGVGASIGTIIGSLSVAVLGYKQIGGWPTAGFVVLAVLALVAAIALGDLDMKREAAKRLADEEAAAKILADKAERQRLVDEVAERLDGEAMLRGLAALSPEERKHQRRLLPPESLAILTAAENAAEVERQRQIRLRWEATFRSTSDDGGASLRTGKYTTTETQHDWRAAQAAQRARLGEPWT